MWLKPAGAAARSVILLMVAMAAQPDMTPRGSRQRFDQVKPSAVGAAASVLTPGSDRGRIAMWRHTLEMVLDHPLLGVGLDNWEYAYPIYDRGRTSGKITAESEPVRPHNDFLWILSELGLVGLALFIWLLWCIWRLAGTAIGRGSSPVALTALAGVAGAVGLLGHGLFSFPKEQPATAALRWIVRWHRP